MVFFKPSRIDTWTHWMTFQQLHPVIHQNYNKRYCYIPVYIYNPNGQNLSSMKVTIKPFPLGCLIKWKRKFAWQSRLHLKTAAYNLLLLFSFCSIFTEEIFTKELLKEKKHQEKESPWASSSIPWPLWICLASFAVGRLPVRAGWLFHLNYLDDQISKYWTIVK